MIGPLGILVTLTLLWTLNTAQGLRVNVVDEDGGILYPFSDGSAAFQERSYLMPQRESVAIRGTLVYPKPHNACSVVENPHNKSFIAFLEEYTICPEKAENNLVNAGFTVMVAYSKNSDAYLRRLTHISQALILDKGFADYLMDTVLPQTNTSTLQLVIWDDSFAKLEQLFIIFGAILLVAVFLSICVFCSSVFCRMALVRWRTRGLSRWQVRALPKRKFRKAKESTDTCSICLEEFKEGETVRVLPCDHVFHPKCVDEWLHKWNRTCPLCKSTIKRNGGRAHNPPAQTDDNETSVLLPQEERTSILDNENQTDGGGGTGTGRHYGTMGSTVLPSRNHRRNISAASHTSSNAGQKDHVTSVEIELRVDSDEERRTQSPLSLYHTPQQSDDDNDNDHTPSFTTAHGSHTSNAFASLHA